MTTKIEFKDLSYPLKWAVVLSWIAGILTILSFSLGFLEGFAKAYAG